jgi:hypothetical protein
MSRELKFTILLQISLLQVSMWPNVTPSPPTPILVVHTVPVGPLMQVVAEDVAKDDLLPTIISQIPIPAIGLYVRFVVSLVI